MSAFSDARERYDQAQSEQSETQSESAETQTNQPVAQGLPELEKFERFKFDNREWTPAEIKSAIMMQADYTRKTQELGRERETITKERDTFGKERQFYSALPSDLKAVRENPNLAEEFRKIYPQEFHSYLDLIAAGATPQQAIQAHQQVQQQPSIPREFEERFNTLESAWREQETEKSLAQIDTYIQEFSKKYDFADERTVLASAQQAFSEGVKLDKGAWEKLFKADHEHHQKRYDAKYKEKINQQTTANAKSRDVGAGGGTPGKAPPKLNFKQARDAFIAEAEGRS